MTEPIQAAKKIGIHYVREFVKKRLQKRSRRIDCPACYSYFAFIRHGVWRCYRCNAVGVKED